MKKISTKKMTILALFSALAVVLCLLFRVPLVPSVPFLTYDPKDVVIGIAGFLYGPVSAFIVSAISSLLELMFHGGNILDWLMDVLSSCSFICTAAYIYKKLHSKNGAFIGLCAGTAAAVVVMVIWNYFVTPFYYGMPQEVVNGLLPAIALFNFLKAAINSVIILLVYKPVSNALHKSGLVDKRESSVPSNKKTMAVVGTVILATVILATVIVAILATMRTLG